MRPTWHTTEVDEDEDDDDPKIEVSNDCCWVRVDGEKMAVRTLDENMKQCMLKAVEEDAMAATGKQEKHLKQMLKNLREKMRASDHDNRDGEKKTEMPQEEWVRRERECGQWKRRSIKSRGTSKEARRQQTKANMRIMAKSR